jgi:4'-phosphopantetheinyl transferase
MSISILYYKVSQERICSAQQSEQIANWVEELPLNKQQQIKKLRQPNDQLLSLAGLQLLKIAIPEFSDQPFSLDQLQFPAQAKPFFAGNIDFNISHSKDIVCCVISSTTKVGIDIELQRAVKDATLNKFLNDTPDSRKNNSIENDVYQFFNLWTKNEAIIKAANHGSIYNMKDIKPEHNGGYYQNNFWYTYPVNIVSAEENKEYTCHVACSEYITPQKIKLRQIHKL